MTSVSESLPVTSRVPILGRSVTSDMDLLDHALATTGCSSILTNISGSPDYNKCNTENAIKITKEGFKNFRDEYAEMQKPFRGCSISADEKFIFCYNNYMKQWRHSYYADYYIFDIEKGQSSQ